MSLAVLNVAYPLAPVGPDATGGAEQVLTLLDRALVKAGHTSVVVACEGSQAAGTLVPIPRITGPLDEAAQRAAHAATREAIRRALRQWPVDGIHFHGVDFPAYLPASAAPMIATLHLPPSWYAPEAFRSAATLVCVSETQWRDCAERAPLTTLIPNGVMLDAFEATPRKREFAIALGRICREKGYHLALDAASKAEVPMFLAGEVFPYPAHVEYFDREIAPRLGRRRRWLGPVGLRRKRRLLAAARCLVVSSLVAETSSLVAMEALASGTPVVAFRSGALRQIVEHGRTGFLVEGVDEMAAAIRRTHEIDPAACRAAARERFSADRMCAAYLALYERIGSLREVACGAS